MSKTKDSEFFDKIKSIISKDKEGFINHIFDSFAIFQKEKSKDRDYIHKLFNTFILNVAKTFKNNLEEKFKDIKNVINIGGDENKFFLIGYPIEIIDWNNISIKAPINPIKEEELHFEEAINKIASTRFFRFCELRVMNYLNNNAGMLVDKEKWIPIQFDNDLNKYRKLTDNEYKEILSNCCRDSCYVHDLKGNIKTGKGTYKKYKGIFSIIFLPFIINKDDKEAYQLVGIGIIVNSGYKLKNWTLEDLKKQINIIIDKLEKGALDDSYGFEFKLSDNLLEKTGFKKSKILSDQRVTKIEKEFSELTLSLFSNVGFVYGDYKGQTKKRGIIEYIFINKKGQSALLPQSKMHLLIKKQKEEQDLLFLSPPDATVSQLKNLYTLIILLDRQNRERISRGEDKTNVIDFYLKEYEEIRGKTEEELARGGKFRDLFKYTLVSGGITTFISEDERYYKIRHHHFYDIDIPKNPKKKWHVYVNNPYAEALLNFKQYVPIFLKAIQDKKTDHNKGYLFFFLMTVLHYSNNQYTGFKTQMKISTLLEGIKIGERVKNRPSEAFRVLAECISYVADNYKNVLSEIRLLNSKYELMVIRNLNIFKNIDYKQFKENYLNVLGIKDIREALISFNAIAPKEEGDQEPKYYQEGLFLPI